MSTNHSFKEQKMKIKKLLLLAIVLSITTAYFTGCSRPQGVTAKSKKTFVRQMRDDTLAELYAEKPETKKMIKKAPGYAVFSDINVNIIFVSASNGYGLVVNNDTKEETYMKMAQVGLGLGLGLKDFRAVFIFENKTALDKFVNKGWEFGGHADAAAKSGEKGGAAGGAASFQDIRIYQFTKSGITLQATIAGTKYWKDDELN